MKTKVIVSIAILLAGTLFTIVLHDVGTHSTRYRSEGILIDFGGYDTAWTNADYNVKSTPLDLLDYACEDLGYTYTITAGKVTEINGICNNTEGTWDLWYITEDSNTYSKSDNYDIDPSKNKITTWAYCSEDSVPTLALDATGTSIYGYSQATRIITLSPVCTEIIGSMKAVNTLVGTDAFSNYPHSVQRGHDDGSIAIVGTYTDPSYESIMHASPEMVFCDGSQYNQRQMAATLRNSDVNTVTIYNGESINTIIDNIFIVGTAMGYGLRAKNVINDLLTAMDTLTAIIGTGNGCKTMFSLSTDSAPWIAGNSTYASDIMTTMGGSNIYSGLSGWTHINSEYIGGTPGGQYDPEVIMVVLDSSYKATQEDYDYVMNNLPANWKSTTACNTGQIYLLCEELGEMSQRSGPRFAQLSEIIGRILNPSAFTDGIVLPKYIGDNYEDYLSTTKYLGYDN